MKITREELKEWNYPCFGKSATGRVVYFTEEYVGYSVNTPFEDGDVWNMSFFTPIDNPFEDEKKFNPITIVLETETEAVNMHQAMRREGNLIDVEYTTKLGYLLD